MIDNVKRLGHDGRSGERIGLVLSDGAARGAYEMGCCRCCGTSLNTPLKPAFAFGAERLTVIGLNWTAGGPRDVLCDAAALPDHGAPSGQPAVRLESSRDRAVGSRADWTHR